MTALENLTLIFFLREANMADLTVTKVTNLYLYGQDDSGIG